MGNSQRASRSLCVFLAIFVRNFSSTHKNKDLLKLYLNVQNLVNIFKNIYMINCTNLRNLQNIFTHTAACVVDYCCKYSGATQKQPIFTIYAITLYITGGSLPLLVERTAPAIGNVTVDWRIEGPEVLMTFVDTSGTLLFSEVQYSTIRVNASLLK